MPFANAQMIWCNQQQAEDVDGDGNPIRSYGGASRSAKWSVYHPTACSEYDQRLRGYAYGTPSFSPGQRVYCRWNPQSCRWEIMAPALNIWRVMLNGMYAPASTHVTPT